MLPNLDKLSLHDVAHTMGFYEPTEEEQANMNDDPVTLEKPAYVMSFRVRLPDDGPNGEPRYKFFAPQALWTWVKENNSLPAREGPIWYEDWWALCNTYNPDHHNIPSWARSLKHRSEYVAERARERAREAQQAARERAREEQEQERRGEGAPNPVAAPRRRLPRIAAGTVRHGPQRITDHLVEWKFWVKSGQNIANMGETLSRHFARNLSTSSFRENPSIVARPFLLENLRWRLVVTITQFSSYPDADMPGTMAAGPMKRIGCKLYLPRAVAERFKIWLEEKIARLGVPPVFLLLFGLVEARQFSEADYVVHRGEYYDNDTGQGPPYSIPSMTHEEYEAWRTLRMTLWGGAVHDEQDETDRLASMLAWEQARNERLEERAALERARLAAGSLGAGSSSSSDAGPYVPTSPTYSPTSPSYDPMETPEDPPIDPQTPDREGGESSGAQRAYRFMDPNDPEYAVTIRWRFWLKGGMGGREVLDAEEAMRSHFAAYVANNSELSAGNNGFSWYHRLRVEIFGREYMTQSTRTGVATTHRGILRCEFSLKVSEQTAYRFIEWSTNDRANRWFSWAVQAEFWHNYAPTRAMEASDFPRSDPVLSNYPSPPDMATEDYNRWGHWGVLPEPMFRSLT